ncbi:MAG: ABC transporter substrate-binding protein [Actinomycetota bacterium]|nr:ABC transporter substrate-binding protein [Actinomycetota bacterium]
MAVATGERRIVSVLIADLVDSTGIAEKLGPERSKFLMDEVMRIMTSQVRRYDGTVAQLAGDEVLALFGAPLAHEDDSERAVRAALAIQRALQRYAEEVEVAYGVKLAARAGVNTGPVVVSREGEDGHVRWNALGDTVNVAARLQEIAPPGEVAVGITTARQVEECFELEPLGERELRGKSAPVTTFRVLHPREPGPTPPAGPLVGRDFELTVLERALDGLVDGRGVIVSIIGEAGIGKSRLVAEAREHFRDRTRFVEGRAVSYAASFPYWPIRELLLEWLEVGVSTAEARVRLELKAHLSDLFGESPDDVYPFLATVLGLTLEPEAAARVRELNRESVQQQTFEAFARLVTRLATEEPLCLVLEDLHWADDSTLGLLEDALRVTEEAAVGLLFLYRSEREHASWHLGERARQRYPHRYREIELRPLPADASRALVAGAADGDVPEAVAELLAERAGGNPFFLEEAFRDLVERGALRRADGRWKLAVDVDELAIPAVVQTALQARLDRLDGRAREVLNLAAVVGRRFGLPLLERLVPHAELVSAVSELQRLDLVVEQRRRPAPEYRFRHGLVQEAAYATLVDATRRRLHRRVGEALEDIRRDSLEEVYADLARHFSAADEPEKAVEYLLRAGDAARAIYADEEALEHYRRARDFLARIGDDRRARETLFKIALTHHLAFDFEGAEEAYDEAFCCKVDEAPRLESTERVETAVFRPDDITPGHMYSNEGVFFTEHLFRGLLMVDRDLNVVPAMADNFRVSSDGREYLFRLREGVCWSDGVPLTAEDFAFAWRRTREEETRTAFLLEDVERAEALDDRTLAVGLREPRSYFPYVLASAWSFPWPRHKCEELGEDWRRPENLVGNGPFVLTEHDDEHALLKANPHWVGPRGNVDEICAVFRAKGEEALAAWQEGRFDVLHVSVPGGEEAPETAAVTIPSLAVDYVGFCADRPPFSNGLVRKAFAHALDRERFASSRTTLARPATVGGAIPPAMPGHSHRVGVAYDLDLARRLLADAGHPDGRGLPELRLVVPDWLGSAGALAEQWAELGAHVTVVPAKPSVRLQDLAGAHLWFAGWTADYPDPDGFFRGFFEIEWPFYRDGELRELLQRARFLTDRDERMRLYHEVDRVWVAEHAAILPVAYPRMMLLRRPWIEGLWANPLSRPQLDQVEVRRA